VSKTGEKEILLLAQEALAKTLSSLMAQGVAADFLELLAQEFFFGFGTPSAPFSLGKLAVCPAGVANKSLNLLTKAPGRRIKRAPLEQGQFFSKFPGFGFNVGQAGLAPLWVDAVVGSISIGDQDAAKILSQQFLGSFG